MNKPISFCLLFYFLIGSSIVFSQNKDEFLPVSNSTELKEKIKISSASTNSLSSNFIQEKHLTMMKEVLVSKGNFLFKKENNVRWQYTHPIDYTIFIFNNQFTILNDGKISSFDMASNKMFSEINRLIVTAINGDFIENQQFSATYFENKQFYKVSLKPIQQEVANMLTAIEIYFDKNSMSVNHVRFIEPGDDFTLITFTDRKMNIEIADKNFVAGNEKN